MSVPLIRTMLATVVTAVLFTVAAPPAAHADKPCAYTLPEVPGECLSATTYTYIAEVQRQRDRALVDAAGQRSLNGALVAENSRLRFDLWEQARLRQVAEQQQSIAAGDRDAALEAVAFFRNKVAALRARVHELRLILAGGTP